MARVVEGKRGHCHVNRMHVRESVSVVFEDDAVLVGAVMRLAC